MEFNNMELNDQMDNIIVLEDEHGNPVEFTFLDSIVTFKIIFLTSFQF